MESGELRVGELARRTALTVRTLHHWEAKGLLAPSGRTPSGHRLYGYEAIQRLQRIRSLKSLGLGLEEIRVILDAGASSLEEALQAQRGQVVGQLQMLEALKDRLDKTLRLLKEQGEVPPEELMRNMEMMTAIERHFSSRQLEALKERAESVGADAIQRAQEEWPRLIERMTAKMEAGVDPSDPAVQLLATRWRGLVQAFTGGDPEVEKSLSRMFRSEPGLGEAQGLSGGLFEYVQRAMNLLPKVPQGSSK